MSKENDWPVIMIAEEACAFLRINYRTLLKLTHSGELPHRRVGRSFRYYRDDLIDYVRGIDKAGSEAGDEDED